MADRQGLGLRRAKSALVRHDDLDDLAGSWGSKETRDSERATAPFTKIDGLRAGRELDDFLP